MKTINRNGAYQRVSNEVAERLVRANQATYSPKSEWKINVRDVKRSEKIVTEELSETVKSVRSRSAKKDARNKSKRKI
jgi:hypothetical protein